MTPGSGGLPLGLQIVGRRFEDDLVLRAAAAWERAQPWETASLAPARGAPGARRARRGRGCGSRASRRSPATEAWSLDAPVRAGELFALGDGRQRARGARLEPEGGRAGGLLPARAMSGGSDGGRRARRAEIRRRQVRRRRATGAALLVAVAGIGIWAAATLASGNERGRDDRLDRGVDDDRRGHDGGNRAHDRLRAADDDHGGPT